MGNLELELAQRKMTSLLYLSIGKTGRKMLLLDKAPQINILLIQLNAILQHCNECFRKSRNRTLDRHTFLSRNQIPSEKQHQFRNVLNVLAAKCDFEDQTESLVYDIFILNMLNMRARENFCTGPRDTPSDALQFATAFKDGLRRQRIYGYIGQETRNKGRTSVCSEWKMPECTRGLEISR